MDEVYGQGDAISKMMKSWITQKGFPCVSFTYCKEKNSLTVKQHQFESLVQSDAADKSSQFWSVPINIKYKTESGKQNRIERLMEESVIEIELPAEDPLKSICLDHNADTMLLYDPNNLRDMIHSDFNYLAPIDKMSYFINNAFMVFDHSLFY